MIGSLDHHHQLPGEELHSGLGERLQRGGIAIADGTEGTGTCDLKGQLVVAVRDERATAVGEAYGDESQVFAVGLEG